MRFRVAFALTAGVCLAGASPGPAAAVTTTVAPTGAISGTNGSDHLVGTNDRDVIYGHAGNDKIRPRAGRDLVRAGRGDDYVFITGDHRADSVYCGPGFDVVTYTFNIDPHDVIADSCEGVIA